MYKLLKLVLSPILSGSEPLSLYKIFVKKIRLLIISTKKNDSCSQIKKNIQDNRKGVGRDVTPPQKCLELKCSMSTGDFYLKKFEDF